MIAGPIGTYFLTLHTVFRGRSLCDLTFDEKDTELFVGNSTWAGATAAFMANMVLIAYVIVAMKEDEGEKRASEEKAKKGQ